ncbi:hypothetical protein [Vibrio crassostreae]|uniref:hypothetical protein n=1 Tax=Vibrio crassostreae TaxID=246167 RepID=UPI001B30D670|nr:hypothetical protein [Vibrio crassostreae]
MTKGKQTANKSLYGNILMGASIRIELINVEHIPKEFINKLKTHFDEIVFTMAEDQTKSMLDAASFKLAKLLEDDTLTAQKYTNLLRIIKSVKDARFSSVTKKKPYIEDSQLIIDGAFALALLGDFPEGDKDTLRDIILELDEDEPMFLFSVVQTKERECHYENAILAQTFFGLDEPRTEFVVDSPLVDNFTLKLS